MRSKPGSIVVGVDGSPHSARAVEWAVEQATAEHRTLTLMHTAHAMTPAFMDAAIADAQGARSAMEDAGKEVLAHARETVERSAQELEVHGVFDIADPRDALLHASETASMLVVGSRGRGQVRTLLLGSVNVALARHARCPVVVVRPQRSGTARGGIVVGIDSSPESRPVLEFAFRQASVRDLPLTVIHTAWDIQAGTSGARLVADEMGDVEGERRGLAEALAGMREEYPDVQVATRLAKGTPEQVLTSLSSQSDLLVVGAHQNSRVSQAFLGSVSVSVVENAQCPVAVVPLSTAHSAQPIS